MVVTVKHEYQIFWFYIFKDKPINRHINENLSTRQAFLFHVWLLIGRQYHENWLNYAFHWFYLQTQKQGSHA